MSQKQELKQLIQCSSDKGKVFIQKCGASQCQQLFEGMRLCPIRIIEQTLDEQRRLSQQFRIEVTNHILNQRVMIVLQQIVTFKRKIMPYVLQLVGVIMVIASSIFRYYCILTDEKSELRVSIGNVIQTINRGDYIQVVNPFIIWRQYWELVTTIGCIVVGGGICWYVGRGGWKRGRILMERRMEIRQLVTIYQRYISVGCLWLIDQQID